MEIEKILKDYYPSYDSPIDLSFMSNMISDANTQLENAVFRAVTGVGIDIDKEKLIQALEQDKRRYNGAYEGGYIEGYKKGFADCMKKLREYIEGNKEEEE